MSTRQRAELFTRYLGLELKGQITARGFTAKDVAEKTGRSVAAFNRWINGRAELPAVALCEACELIGIEPTRVVEDAYARMVMELGEVDGMQYEQEPDARVYDFPAHPVSEPDGMSLRAAKRLDGRRESVESAHNEEP